jgi:DNA-binding transcriptional regulator GbsR (MarR family)
MVTVHAMNQAKAKRESSFLLRLLNFTSVPLDVATAIAVRGLFAVVSTLKTEKQTKSVQELIHILGDALSVKTQEQSNEALIKFFDLQQQILTEITNPPSWKQQIQEWVRERTKRKSPKKS